MKTALFCLAAAFLGTSASISPAQTKVQDETKVSFAKEIQPIIKQSCLRCHSGDRAAKGLDLSTHESLMKGTRFGKVVVAGKSADSVIYKSIKGLPGGTKMPPGRNPALTEANIKLIAKWIDQGALKN